MPREQILQAAYSRGFEKGALFGRGKPDDAEHQRYLKLISNSDLPAAVKQRLLSDPATIEAVRQMYLPFDDLPYSPEGEYQSDTDQANAPWHFIHDYFGPSRGWDAYVSENPDTVPGLNPGATLADLYTDTDEEDRQNAEAFAQKILAARQNNVPDHLKAAYARGFEKGAQVLSAARLEDLRNRTKGPRKSVWRGALTGAGVLGGLGAAPAMAQGSLADAALTGSVGVGAGALLGSLIHHYNNRANNLVDVLQDPEVNDYERTLLSNPRLFNGLLGMLKERERREAKGKGTAV